MTTELHLKDIVRLSDGTKGKIIEFSVGTGSERIRLDIQTDNWSLETGNYPWVDADTLTIWGESYQCPQCGAESRESCHPDCPETN
jgi:hypothetical protein